jgi:hypothetical protein
MPKIKITAEQQRDPLESEDTVVRNEDAEGCYGEVCGQYYEDEDGSALRPSAHSHAVVTGHNPEAASRVWAISK